jgi:hypothetical protein
MTIFGDYTMLTKICGYPGGGERFTVQFTAVGYMATFAFSSNPIPRIISSIVAVTMAAVTIICALPSLVKPL